MTSITTYFNEAVEELRHVRWPTRQQAVKLSIVVIIFTAISTLFFGVADYLLSQVLNFFLARAV